MAEYTELQLRRDSTLNWYASNPRLALGEPGVDMDLHRFKIGNGIDRWNELPYMDDDLYKLLNEQDQKTADKVQDLLNKIAANKLDADQKYNAVTSELRNTSRDLTGRMTTVETEQAEYQEELTERQQSFESTVTKNQQEYQKNLTERQQEFEEAVTGDFEDTKAEVHAGLDEFNQTRDRLDTRMDVIVGQATEDTEILDARVDAEYHTHPNLGENIRNIHSEVLKANQAGTEERAARIATYEAERTERVSADERHDAEIARLTDSAKKFSECEEHLQEQADANAAASLAVQEQFFREIERNRRTEYNLEHEAKIVADEAEKLREETAERKQADEELSEWNKHSDAQVLGHAEFLQEQIGETTGEVLNNRFGLYKETEARKQKDTELAGSIQENTSSTREKLSGRAEFLQEQADELTGLVMSEMLQSRENLHVVHEDIQQEARERSKSDYQIRESIAEGLSSAREKNFEAAEHLREQIDLTASELQQANISNWRKIRELDACRKHRHSNSYQAGNAG